MKATSDSESLQETYLRVEDSADPTASEIARAEAAENTAAKLLAVVQKEKNPHSAALVTMDADIAAARKDETEKLNAVKMCEHEVTSYTQLYDLSMDLRGRLLEQSVQSLEAETNKILEAYFDAELRVEFVLDSDKLEIEIQKNGFACSFRQLSGGQRTILKLGFFVALMDAAANRSGVHFEEIFMDEPLSGLDSDTKNKAFRLFQDLATRHSSVTVIEHADALAPLFTTVYHVSMEGDVSTLGGPDARFP